MSLAKKNLNNRWKYIIPSLADFIFQHSEIIIDWTDGEYAHCSIVSMNGLKKDFNNLYALDTQQCIDVCALMRSWSDLKEPFNMDYWLNRIDIVSSLLRKIVRLNENHNHVNAAFREIIFLDSMNSNIKNGYRILPSEFRADFISVNHNNIITATEKEICGFYLGRPPIHNEENRYKGNNPLWLQLLLGKIWCDEWRIGFNTEECKENGEVQRVSVSDGGVVTTKAGTFENCLKLTFSLERISENPNYYADENAWQCGTKEFWYAPGVGIIKIDCTWGSMLTSNTELVSYSLPAEGSGYLPVHIGNKWVYEEINMASKGHICRETLEIAGGMDNKYLLCVSRENGIIDTK